MKGKPNSSPRRARSFHPRKAFPIYHHNMKHVSLETEMLNEVTGLLGAFTSAYRPVCVKNDCGSAGRVGRAAGTPCPSSALASERLAPSPAQASIRAQLAQA